MPYILLILLTYIPDRILKRHIEEDSEFTYPRELGDTGITLHRHHNYGFCMNRLEDHPGLVKGTVCGIYAAALGYAGHQLLTRKEEKRSDQLLLCSLALILGGGLSNLTDRIRRGYVVDYFSLPIKPIRHVIMNIGDLGIFLGCLLMTIAGMAED